MAVTKWNGEQAEALIRRAFARNLHAAAIVVKGRAKVLLSTAGTGTTQGAGGKTRRVYGANPSAPGEPPHKQTGRLRASVAHEVDAGSLRARVGTNVTYGKFLELGTSKMAARPWLRRALNESRARVVALLARRPPGI